MTDTGSADETPMIPEELVPRQTSDDAVANDPDAAGTPNDEDDDATDPDDLS